MTIIRIRPAILRAIERKYPSRSWRNRQRRRRASSGGTRRRRAAARIIDGICPLGDKLGDNTPGEIAVGIVSQLLKLRNVE
jgi:xanthine/CO dehydrogenase XdhC/CoxF family maturation factor